MMVPVNFRLDDVTKARMEEICGRLGMSMSTAFIIYARAIVRNNGIPFPLTLDDDKSGNIADATEDDD